MEAVRLWLLAMVGFGGELVDGMADVAVYVWRDTEKGRCERGR